MHGWKQEEWTIQENNLKVESPSNGSTFLYGKEQGCHSGSQNGSSTILIAGATCLGRMGKTRTTSSFVT